MPLWRWNQRNNGPDPDMCEHTWRVRDVSAALPGTYLCEVCDRCGAEVIARPDDNEHAVRTRLEAFHRQTLPVATFYKAKNVLREVDGIGPVDEVFERIEKSLL